MAGVAGAVLWCTRADLPLASMGVGKPTQQACSGGAAGRKHSAAGRAWTLCGRRPKQTCGIAYICRRAKQTTARSHLREEHGRVAAHAAAQSGAGRGGGPGGVRSIDERLHIACGRDWRGRRGRGMGRRAKRGGGRLLGWASKQHAGQLQGRLRPKPGCISTSWPQGYATHPPAGLGRRERRGPMSRAAVLRGGGRCAARVLRATAPLPRTARKRGRGGRLSSAMPPPVPQCHAA